VDDNTLCMAVPIAMAAAMFLIAWVKPLLFGQKEPDRTLLYNSSREWIQAVSSGEGTSHSSRRTDGAVDAPLSKNLAPGERVSLRT